MRSTLTNVVIKPYEGNYTKGRNTNIGEICIHHMAGVLSAEQCGYIWQKVGRNGSSQYGIGNDGRIGSYVDEADTAWCNSNWESNCRSVSIEVSNCEMGGQWRVSDAALNSLIKLVADIAKRNNMGTLVKGKNVTWHRMYTSTSCPGEYLLSKMDYIVSEANRINSSPDPQPTPSTGFNVGDIVTTIEHGFAASDGTGNTSIIVNNPTPITRINGGSKYPYLVGDIGWFKESSLRKNKANTFKIGDMVRVKRGATSYEGARLAAFVYDNVYRIDELKGKRAVLDLTGICTAVNTDNLIK